MEADPRELIRDYLLQQVEHSVVRTRTDVIATIEDAGFEVPRQGKSYITALDPESRKPWKLKGSVSEHSHNPTAEKLTWHVNRPSLPARGI